MLSFQIPHSSKLLARLTQSPPKARAKYYRRIRNLLKELKDERDYPFDYVRFRIIGYCIDKDTGQCFSSEQLKADLEQFAEEIRPVTARDEPLQSASPAQSPASKDLEPEPDYIFESAFSDNTIEHNILKEGGDACKNSRGRLLTREEEADVFRCYNYCKFKVTLLTTQIADSVDRFAVVEEINFYKDIALQCRNHIIELNLRLVYKAVQTHLGKNLSFEELVSDGNNSLMRAVEKFDYRRGNKFSTYATWAITKNFARSVPRENAFLKTFRTEADDLFDGVEADEKKNKTRLLPRLWKTIEEAIEKLPEKERIAVTHFFGVQGAPISLREIAPKMGLRSKEIARRYKDRGLARLQQLLDSELYEQIYT